jgi:hypothetical protein
MLRLTNLLCALLVTTTIAVGCSGAGDNDPVVDPTDQSVDKLSKNQWDALETNASTDLSGGSSFGLGGGLGSCVCIPHRCCCGPIGEPCKWCPGPRPCVVSPF